jgi:hypothetical protein
MDRDSLTLKILNGSRPERGVTRKEGRKTGRQEGMKAWWRGKTKGRVIVGMSNTEQPLQAVAGDTATF